MINDIISMNGYGIYVWSAFAFTLISFTVLYTVIKVQLDKERTRFNSKYLTLISEKKEIVRTQEAYKGILVNKSASKGISLNFNNALYFSSRSSFLAFFK